LYLGALAELDAFRDACSGRWRTLERDARQILAAAVDRSGNGARAGAAASVSAKQHKPKRFAQEVARQLLAPVPKHERGSAGKPKRPLQLAVVPVEHAVGRDDLCALLTIQEPGVLRIEQHVFFRTS
jgi:hypothetical protein